MKEGVGERGEGIKERGVKEMEVMVGWRKQMVESFHRQGSVKVPPKFSITNFNPCHHQLLQ